MKTLRILGLAFCSILAGCTALMPQTSSVESDGESASPSGPGGVVVEEVVEIGSESYAYEGDEGPTTVEIVGGDENALREFIERWLGSSYPGQPQDHITIYLGSLPPDMVYSIPIPENARLIASYQQTRFDVLQLILDIPRPVAEIRAFYDAALPKAGWQAADAGHGGGFVSSDTSMNYCLDEKTSLNLIAVSLADEQTDLRIYVQTSDGYSVCSPDETYGMSPWEKLIPVLKAPPGVTTTSGGSGSSSEGEAYTEAHLTGEISAPDLAAYYNEQLATIGWTLLEKGGEESTGWSYWSLISEDGKELYGKLIVTKVPPSSDQLFAYIRVSRTP